MKDPRGYLCIEDTKVIGAEARRQVLAIPLVNEFDNLVIVIKVHDNNRMNGLEKYVSQSSKSCYNAGTDLLPLNVLCGICLCLREY